MLSVSVQSHFLKKSSTNIPSALNTFSNQQINHVYRDLLSQSNQAVLCNIKHERSAQPQRHRADAE